MVLSHSEDLKEKVLALRRSEFTRDDSLALMEAEIKVKKLEGWLKYLWNRYGEGFPQNEIEQEISDYIKAMEGAMSCHTKEELENMLEDVVNVLDLSDSMIKEHGPLGTPPAELVKIVLGQKDRIIRMLRQGFIDITPV